MSNRAHGAGTSPKKGFVRHRSAEDDPWCGMCGALLAKSRKSFLCPPCERSIPQEPPARTHCGMCQEELPAKPSSPLCKRCDDDLTKRARKLDRQRQNPATFPLPRVSGKGKKIFREIAPRLKSNGALSSSRATEIVDWAVHLWRQENPDKEAIFLADEKDLLWHLRSWMTFNWNRIKRDPHESR